MKPFVVWTGSKWRYRRLLPLPRSFNTYLEPFVGGGGMLFNLKPPKFIINDSNADLMNLYETIDANVYELIERLKVIPTDKATFEIQLAKMNDKTQTMTQTERAVTYLYLRQLAFNSHLNFKLDGTYVCAYRSNRGNKSICDAPNLIAVSRFLQTGSIMNTDYQDVLALAVPNDFVFLDPPYVTPVTRMLYNDDWNQRLDKYEAHYAFLEEVMKLHRRGVKFVLTYNQDEHLAALYKQHGFTLTYISKISSVVAHFNGQPYTEMVIHNLHDNDIIYLI